MAARRNSKRGVWLGVLAVEIFLPAVLFKFSAAAGIIEGPANHTVPIGTTVTFPCVAQGGDAFFEINTTAINYPEDMIPFIEKGFSLSEQYTATTSNLTLTVNARPENNNTRITCLVYPLDYRTGRLTVMGPPSPPEPQLHVLSATAIQIFWLPPFSWDEYPIVNYTVQVHNRITREVTNSTVNATAAPVTFIHNTPHGRVMWNCEELIFRVFAANNIGRSKPAVVTGGFPIVPRLNVTAIETMVTFQFDGTPLLRLSIQLPGICLFQKLNYTITIQQISPTHSTLSSAGQADNIIVIGPKTVVGRTNVNEVVNSNLVVDTMYSVLVDFNSLAGNASSNTTFGTRFQSTPKSTDATAEGTRFQSTPKSTDATAEGTHFQPTSKCTDATGKAGVSLVGKIVIGVSVGLISIVAFTIMLLVLCGFKFCKHSSGSVATLDTGKEEMNIKMKENVYN